jgi:hypothetical protein
MTPLWFCRRLPWRSLVLRESDPQPSLWEALVPEEAKRLPAELVKIDAYLDDERFITPWRRLFDRWFCASAWTSPSHTHHLKRSSPRCWRSRTARP